jgi:hypothetical protein
MMSHARSIVEQSSDGVVRMGPATLYGTLKKLVAAGRPSRDLDSPTNPDLRRHLLIASAVLAVVCVVATNETPA